MSSAASAQIYHLVFEVIYVGSKEIAFVKTSRVPEAFGTIAHVSELSCMFLIRLILSGAHCINPTFKVLSPFFFIVQGYC